MRAALFGGIAVAVAVALFAIVFWLTWQLLDYEELGDYLVRLGLSWLFLTFLSFVAFSAIVTSLSTFFLSEDLRLLLPAPVPRDRLFHSRLARTVAQSSWMVAAFVLPVLLAIGLARCAPASYYAIAVATVVPFVVIPSALGSVVTLGLVSVFPARRARDVLMLMGLLFAVAIVLLLRFIRPERLLSVQSIPDVTAFFATLQSPVTPFLPSFWAGESLFAGLRRRPRRRPPRGAVDLGGSRGRGGPPRLRPALLRGVEQGAGGPQGAFHAPALARPSRATPPRLPGAARAAREGREGVPARHRPVVPAPPARGPRPRLRLQLPRARPRPRTVHEPLHPQRLRVREPRDGRVRDLGGGGPVRLPGRVRRGTRLLDRAERPR